MFVAIFVYDILHIPPLASFYTFDYAQEFHVNQLVCHSTTQRMRWSITSLISHAMEAVPLPPSSSATLQ